MILIEDDLKTEYIQTENANKVSMIVGLKEQGSLQMDGS